MPNISINLLTRGRKHVLSKEDVKEINGLLLDLSANIKPVSEDFILSVADKGILFIGQKTPTQYLLGLNLPADLPELRQTNFTNRLVLKNMRPTSIGKKYYNFSLKTRVLPVFF